MLRRVPATSVSRTCRPWLSSPARSNAVRAAVTSRSVPPRAALRRRRGRVRVAAGGLELLERDLALGACFAPLGLLRDQRGGIGLELRQLVAQRLRRALGFLAHRARALQALVGGAEAPRDVGLLDLPVHPLLPRGLLFRLELTQAAAAAAQILVQAAASEVTLDQGGIDLGQPLLGSAESLGHPGELRLRLRHLAREIADDPKRVVPGGGPLSFGLAGLFGGGGRGRQARLALGQPPDRRLQLGLGGGQRGRSVFHVVREG